MQVNLHPIVLAAMELQQALLEFGRPFCFIGGLALQRWGQPRYTSDADATLLTEWLNDEAAIAFLLGRFRPRKPGMFEFALRHRVLLLYSSDDVNLDVALGAVDFERRSIERSTEWNYHGHRLRTCSAEDLVVHKAFASRPQDWVDVENVLMAQGSTLDAKLILDELRPLAALKEDDRIVPRLEALMRKRRVIGAD
jgi:hypothetical protein